MNIPKFVARELDAMEKQTMTDKKIDDYHWHEVVDRSYLCMEMLACALEEHPVIEANPELSELLDKAHSAIFKLYQRAGDLHLMRSVSSSDAARETDK